MLGTTQVWWNCGSGHRLSEGCECLHYHLSEAPRLNPPELGSTNLIVQQMRCVHMLLVYVFDLSFLSDVEAHVSFRGECCLIQVEFPGAFEVEQPTRHVPFPT